MSTGKKLPPGEYRASNPWEWLFSRTHDWCIPSSSPKNEHVTGLEFDFSFRASGLTCPINWYVDLAVESGKDELWKKATRSQS